MVERRMIELRSNITPGGMTHTQTCKGFKCEYCQGNGYHWVAWESREPFKKTCPVCGGSGTLDAKVTVEWTPGGVSEHRR